jgi:hypothetical protein
MAFCASMALGKAAAPAALATSKSRCSFWIAASAASALCSARCSASAAAAVAVSDAASSSLTVVELLSRSGRHSTSAGAGSGFIHSSSRSGGLFFKNPNIWRSRMILAFFAY